MNHPASAPRSAKSPAGRDPARLAIPRVSSPDTISPSDTTTPDALRFYKSDLPQDLQTVPLSARSLAAIPVSKRSVRDIAAQYNQVSNASLPLRDNSRSSSVPVDKLALTKTNSRGDDPAKLQKPQPAISHRRKSMEDGRKRLSKILGLPSSPPRSAAVGRSNPDWVEVSPTYLFGEVGADTDNAVGHGIGRRGSEGSMRMRPANLDLTAAAPQNNVHSGPFTADHQRSKSDMTSPGSPYSQQQLAQQQLTQEQLKVPQGFSSRRPTTPPASLSFSTHSKTLSGDHPTLKAYIKQSPQKESPPLRSSRPRQQLSSYAQHTMDKKPVSTLQGLSDAVYQGPRRKETSQAAGGVPAPRSAASTDGGNTDIEDGDVYLTSSTFQPGSSLSLHTAAGLQQAQAQARSFDTADSPTLPEDTGTIQIMLGDRSLLSAPSVQQQTRFLRDNSNAASPTLSFQQGQRQDMGSTWAYVSNDPTSPGRLTLDSDGYNAIHNIITQYEENGSLSPQLVSALDRHVVEEESSMSPKDAVNDLVRQIDFSRQNSAKSTDAPLSPFSIAMPTREQMQARKAKSTASHETDFEDSDSEIQDDYNPRPTQARKDSATLTAEDNRLLAESEQRRNRNSILVAGATGAAPSHFGGAQPSLPNVPDTNGTLGALGALDAPSRISYLPQFPQFVPEDVSPCQPMRTPGSTESYFDFANISRQDATSQRRTSSIPSASSAALSMHSSEQLTPTEQEAPARSQGRDERKLTQRKYIINEIINTEFAYHRDMAIVEDIYMGTISSCVELTEDDSRALFANTPAIVSFSRNFADSMKEHCKGVWVRPPKDKRPQYVQPKDASEERRPSSVATNSSIGSLDGSDEERDRGTRIGHVFMEYMSQMEKLYSEYLKNHDNANQRLTKIQHADRVQTWLDECGTYVKGLSDAWNLDALLIKPTQRIMKYPMLLGQLLKETPRDHPDFTALEMARKEVMNVTHRINEAKKRAELLDKVFNPGKPGRDRDITKPFTNIMKGRAEKFKQNAGMAETYEDAEYVPLVQKFSNSYIQLQVVMKDITMYKTDGERFVRQFNSLAGAWGGMIDVGPTPSPEIESKWRKWAQNVRELILFAWADHILAIEKYCIKPIKTCISMYDRTQSLIRERKKRLPEFAAYQSRKDKSEKIDKKTQEHAEQFTALNDSLKEELPKLYQLSSKLVNRCQLNWIDILATWNEVALKKMRQVLDDGNQVSSWQDIVSSFHREHQYGIDDITSLGICNGSYSQDSSNFLATSAASVSEDGRVKRPRPSFDSAQDHHAKASSVDHQRSTGSSSNPRPSFDNPRQGGGTTGTTHQHQRVRSTSGGTQQRPQGPPAGAAVTPNGTYTFQQRAGAHAATYDSNGRYYANHSSQHHYNSSAPQLFPRPNNASDTTLVTPSNASISNASMSSTSTVTPAHYAPTSRNNQNVFSSATPDGSSGSRHNSANPSRSNSRNNAAPVSNNRPRQRVLWLAASLFDFRLDTVRTEAGYPYLCYDPGEIFDVIGERGELWLARNQDDPSGPIGWIWEKHFAKLINDDS